MRSGSSWGSVQQRGLPGNLRRRNMGDGNDSVAAMLSGGCIERAAWYSERCDELCAALRKAVESSSVLNLEGRNTDGDTPFLLACNAGHVAYMGSLVAAGCDTAAKDNDGMDGLMNAALSGNPAAVRAASWRHRPHVPAGNNTERGSSRLAREGAQGADCRGGADGYAGQRSGDYSK